MSIVCKTLDYLPLIPCPFLAISLTSAAVLTFVLSSFHGDLLLLRRSGDGDRLCGAFLSRRSRSSRAYIRRLRLTCRRSSHCNSQKPSSEGDESSAYQSQVTHGYGLSVS